MYSKRTGFVLGFHGCDREIRDKIVSQKGAIYCAVIETAHGIAKQLGKPEYDSVRGVFFEGNDLYKNAGFKEKNHIQIAVRNQNCIKGFFIPRDLE